MAIFHVQVIETCGYWVEVNADNETQAFEIVSGCDFDDSQRLGKTLETYDLQVEECEQVEVSEL